MGHAYKIHMKLVTSCAEENDVLGTNVDVSMKLTKSSVCVKIPMPSEQNLTMQ